MNEDLEKKASELEEEMMKKNSNAHQNEIANIITTLYGLTEKYNKQ